MTIATIPEIKCEVPANIFSKAEPPEDILARWDKSVINAQAGSDDATITMYDYIGWDVTARRISAALRSIGKRPVTVCINSPGGDFFEGVAIYNLLREHPYKITVKVMGLAASAASVIAMAGDERLVAKTAFVMIHNAWTFVIGNKNDCIDAAATLSKFDTAMAGLYCDITGIESRKMVKMMDKETFIGGEECIETGFATGLLPHDEVGKQVVDGPNSRHSAGISAAVKVDEILAKEGMSRSERRALIKDLKGMPGATQKVMPSADELTKKVESLIKSMKERVK